MNFRPVDPAVFVICNANEEKSIIPVSITARQVWNNRGASLSATFSRIFKEKEFSQILLQGMFSMSAIKITKPRHFGRDNRRESRRSGSDEHKANEVVPFDRPSSLKKKRRQPTLSSTLLTSLDLRARPEGPFTASLSIVTRIHQLSSRIRRRSYKTNHHHHHRSFFFAPINLEYHPLSLSILLPLSCIKFVQTCVRT